MTEEDTFKSLKESNHQRKKKIIEAFATFLPEFHDRESYNEYIEEASQENVEVQNIPIGHKLRYILTDHNTGTNFETDEFVPEEMENFWRDLNEAGDRFAQDARETIRKETLKYFRRALNEGGTDSHFEKYIDISNSIVNRERNRAVNRYSTEHDFLQRKYNISTKIRYD